MGPVGLASEIFLLIGFSVLGVSQSHHPIDLQQKSDRGVASQWNLVNEGYKLLSLAELDNLV